MSMHGKNHYNKKLIIKKKCVTNKDLLYSTGNSAQGHVAAWMGGGFGGEWRHICVRLTPFAVYQKLSQHCYSAIPQHKIKSIKNPKTSNLLDLCEIILPYGL